MAEDLPAVHLPAVTAEQMREVDRVMVEDLGIELLQMMENAGRHLAELAVRRYRPASCTVLVGPGGNGGGGMVAARHLHNRGVDVVVVPIMPDPASVPGHQLSILRCMGVPILAQPQPAELTIDALLGYSLRGDPREPAAGWIRWANASAAPILALDLPSGLEATTGRVGDPCTTADATLTLALPKVGLLGAAQVVGELYAADISVPPSVYNAMGLPVGAAFADGSIVRLPVTTPDDGS
jgi:NAD(P)H-hydrate epimerase